jgi:PAS domain S-box-containing protein
MSDDSLRRCPQDWVTLFSACDASVLTARQFHELADPSVHELDDLQVSSILNALAFSASTAVFAKNAAGKYIFLNDPFCKALNLSHADIIGSTASELFSEELARKIDEHDQNIMRRGQIHTGRIQLTLSSGAPHVAHITKAPLRNHLGAIIGIIGIIEDLAPIASGGIQAWDTINLLDALFRHCTDGILVTSQKRDVIKANQAIQDIFGMSESEIIDTGPWVLADRSDTRFARIMAERERCGFAKGVFHARKKNGALFEAEASTIQFKADGESLACWIVKDVSALKQAENLSQRWRRMFYGSGLGLAVVQLSDMTLLEVSPSFALERGYRPEELEGLHVSTLCPPERHAQIPALGEAIARYGRHVWEAEHVRKDGSRFPVLMDCTALLDDQGRLTHHLVYTLNLSPLKRIETMLKAVVEGSLAPMILLGPGGDILIANNAWQEYIMAVGEEPKRIGVGANLIEACEIATKRNAPHIASETLAEGARALRKLLRGDIRQYALEYSCATAQGERWFKAECSSFIIDGLPHAILAHHEITASVNASKRLEAQTNALKERARELDEMNTALRVLLNQRERERQELHSQVLSNIREMIVPGLEAIRQDPSCSIQARDRANAIIQHFESILSPFNPAQNLAEMGLPPTESRVVSLVRSGLTSKEIAEMLHISPHTVHYYRTKIRKKLDLAGCRQGLRGLLAAKPCS